MCVRAAEHERRAYQAKKDAEAKRAAQADIASYRQRHGVHPSVSDRQVAALAEMERLVGRQA